MAKGRKIVILDVDMIMTDVLFKINNINPFTNQTFDSVFSLDSVDLENIAKNNGLQARPETEDYFCNRINYRESSVAYDFEKCRDLIDASDIHIVVLTKVYEKVFNCEKHIGDKKVFIDAVMKNHFSKSTHEVHFVPYTKSKMEYIWNYPYIDCKDVCAIVDDNIENIRDIVLGCTLGNNIPKVIYPRRLEWMRPKHFDELFGEIQYY